MFLSTQSVSRLIRDSISSFLKVFGAIGMHYNSDIQWKPKLFQFGKNKVSERKKLKTNILPLRQTTRSNFWLKNNVLKKNATVDVKVCPKNYPFCIPTNFYPNFLIFLHRYICNIWDILQLWPWATISKPSSAKLVEMDRYVMLRQNNIIPDFLKSFLWVLFEAAESAW